MHRELPIEHKDLEVQEWPNFYHGFDEGCQDESSSKSSTFSQISTRSNQRKFYSPELKLQFFDHSDDVSRVNTPQLWKLFEDSEGIQKSLNIFGSLDEYEHCQPETPSFKINQETPITELQVVFEILMMFKTGSVNQKTYLTTFNLPELKLANLSGASLENFLSFFQSLLHKYQLIQDSINCLKRSKTRLLKSLASSISRQVSLFDSKTSDFLSSFSESPYPRTLISLKVTLFRYLDEFSVILKILTSINPDHPEPFQCSELLTLLFNYSQLHMFEFPFIMNCFFFDCFSCYLLDLCGWMMNGFSSSESMIQPIFEDGLEWEKHSFVLVQVGEKLLPCIPHFLRKVSKKILAIGSYQFLYNQIVSSFQFTKIYLEPAEQFHSRVVQNLKKSLKEPSKVDNLGYVISQSFFKEVEIFFQNFGKQLFNAFNEKLALVKIIRMFQKIYLLQDPKFLEFFTPVLQAFRSRSQYVNLSDEMNRFFEGSEYRGFCRCEFLSPAYSIDQIVITFQLPEVFEFVFSGHLQKFSEIFHFLLEIKLASGSIKTLNKEYDWIRYRVEFIHFMNCFEFYAGQATLCELLYGFNAIQMNDIYQVKKTHAQLVELLMKKLFLVEDRAFFLVKTRKIFSYFNQIFYLNYAGVRFDVEDFFHQFSEDFRAMVKIFQDNRNILLNDECNF